MNKFRKWLIRKLGGFVSEDKHLVKMEISELVSIKAEFAIEQELYTHFCEETLKEICIRNITSRIAGKIKPEITLIEEPNNRKIVRARILVPYKYVKECED